MKLLHKNLAECLYVFAIMGVSVLGFAENIESKAAIAGGESSSEIFTLGDAVMQTLIKNPRVLAAVEVRHAREQDVAIAKGGYFPTLDLGLGYGREETKSPSTADSRVRLTREEASLRLRQMLFDGMATSNEVKRQKARSDVAGLEAYAEAENLALRTSEVYLAIMKSDKLRDLAKVTLNVHKKIYSQMNDRLTAGVGSKADLDQISGRLALAYTNFITAESNYRDSVTNYFRVVGVYPELGTFKQPQPLEQYVPETVSESIEKALRNNPTLLAATYDVKAAQAQFGAAKSTFSPTFHLEVDKTFDRNISGQEGRNESLSAMLRMRYNLMKGGAGKSKKRQTAYLLEQAKEVRNSTHRQVIESTQLSWNAFNALDHQMEYLENHVEFAQSTKKAYEVQFNLGQRTLLDLLNTENEYVDATRAKVKADFDKLYAEYRVFNSMGDIFKRLNITPPEEFQAVEELK